MGRRLEDRVGHVSCLADNVRILALQYVTPVHSALLNAYRASKVYNRSVVVSAPPAPASNKPVQGHAEWVAAAKSCAISDTYRYKWGLLVNLLVEIILLGIMFAGVLSKRNGTGLWRVLFVQVCLSI